MIFKIFSICLILGIVTDTANADCELPLPRFRFFAPLIFDSDGALLPTDNDNVHALRLTIPTGKNVVLSCAPNYFKKTEFNASKTLTATCKNDETLEVNGVERLWVPDLGCEVRTVEEILKPIPGCNNPSEQSVEFGYANPIKSKTFVLGEACYSEENGRTLFVHTKHIVNNNKHSVILKTENVNYLSQSHPQSSYKIGFLIAARIDELTKRLEKLSLKKQPFLEHRHFMSMLSLPNGQLYSILKLGWNFVVANGYDHLPNYDLLMADIMSIRDNDFDLYLGSQSTMTLKDLNNNDVDIYLYPDERKYPVPKYLWAVVANESSRKAVAFFISNNIEMNEEQHLNMSPCESKCTQISWLISLSNKDAYKKSKNGYVWCCELSSISEKLRGIPTSIENYKLLI